MSTKIFNKKKNNKNIVYNNNRSSKKIKTLKLTSNSFFFFMMPIMLRVVSMVHMVHVRVKSVVLVRGVRHFAHATVRFNHTVLTVHYVAFSVFRLVFVITRVRVFYTILVRVMRWRLCKNQRQQYNRSIVNDRFDLSRKLKLSINCHII